MSFQGKKHSVESKRKMSLVQKGRKRTKEHSSKLGKYKRTEEQKAQIRKVQLQNCKGKTGEQNFNWKGGESKRNGYIMVRKPEHPNCSKNGYIMKHRLVMEENLGRYLLINEHVHHINGIRTDNRMENLIVITNSEHIRLHRLEEVENGTFHKARNYTRNPKIK